LSRSLRAIIDNGPLFRTFYLATVIVYVYVCIHWRRRSSYSNFIHVFFSVNTQRVRNSLKISIRSKTERVYGLISTLDSGSLTYLKVTLFGFGFRSIHPIGEQLNSAGYKYIRDVSERTRKQKT